MTDKLYWPKKVSTGKVFPKVGVQAETLNGEYFEIDVWADAELWDNGTLFVQSVDNGPQRRINPSTVDYYAKRV